MQPKEPEAVKLGVGGDCDLAASILHGLNPTATVWRITDGKSFSHVFLKLGDKTLDIRGLRTVDAILSEFGGEESTAEETSWDVVRAYFQFLNGEADRSEETQIISDYINSTPENFSFSEKNSEGR